MKILGIETSCDETAAAVVEDGTKIISNVIASSANMHTKTGGVIPEQAAREQIKSIIPVIKEALTPLRQGFAGLDAIAVTVGPGLIGSLLVGVETAKTLSYLWSKPIVPVNHLVGHIYANFIRENSKSKIQNPKFPLLALVVSGGHTDLVYMKKHGDIKYIGGTLDDAAGEAFDKIARILGLPYPGGPAISKLSEEYRRKKPGEKLNLFPRPIINEDNFDWSFSGLKTSVLNFAKAKDLTNDFKEKVSAEVEEAIIEVLVTKSLKAIKKYRPKSFLLAGGVAANTALRTSFEEKILPPTFSASASTSAVLLQGSFHVPKPRLCTDNAAYIAAAGFFNYHPVDWQKIDTQPELTITDQVEV